MKFQEALDNYKKIVFKGFENKEYLFSFDDDETVYRFPEAEVKEVSDMFKSPEQLAHDAKMEESSMIIKEELKDRKEKGLIEGVGMGIVTIISFSASIYTFTTHQGTTISILLVLSGICAFLLSFNGFKRFRKIRSWGY